MRVTARRAEPGVAAIAAVLLTAGASVVWASRAVAQRGTSGLIEVLAAAAVPVAAWFAWTRPLIVPYGLYAIVAPLDVFTVISRHEGTMARLLGALSAVALLLYALRTRSVRTPPRAIVWLALVCGLTALSTLWSIAPDPALEAMTLLQIAGLYLTIAIFPMRHRDLQPLLAAIAIGGIVAAFIGIYEFHTGSLREMQSLQDFHRITVTFGQMNLDPNMYGDSMLLPFAILLVWFIRARRFVVAVGALAAMGAIAVALALVASRDATIGLVIETAMVTTILRAWKRVTLPIGAVIGAAIAAFPNVLVRAIADAGDGGAGRTSIWRVGFTGFLHHPFLGTGSGSYATVYDEWYLRIFEKVDPGWDMASHNLLLHYGVELGTVGLAFVLMWCIAQWLLARALPRTGTLGDVRAICLASLAALGFAAFFIDLFDVKFVWLLFGLIAQARNLVAAKVRS
jgi:exopolysaccharide production protein ExoQ